MGRLAQALVIALGLAGAQAAHASTSRDVSFRPDPFAAAPKLSLPSIAEQLKAVEERVNRASACVALCELAASIEAHPLGREVSIHSPIRTEGFTGHYWDKEASLYYAKARYYDPFTARFTQSDSFLGSIDDPPSLHRYFYANANPTLYVDPTGYESVLPHIAEKDKAGDVARFKQDVFKKDPGRFSDDLTDDEIATLKVLKGTQFKPGRLNETQIAEARTLFGEGASALEQYSNYATRGQLITRLTFADSTLQNYVKELYRTTRDFNIAQFAAERGYQFGSGQEMFTGEEASRGGAALEFATALLGIKVTQAALASIRPPISGGGRATELDRAEARVKQIIQDQKQRVPLTSNQKGDTAKGWSRQAALARGERIIGEEVDLIFTINGQKVAVRADILTRPPGSTTHVYVESKYSGRAPYTDHQKVVIPNLVKSGDAGLVAEIGSRSGALRPGQKIRVVFQGDVWGAQPTLLGH